jgi:hypothetical protein
MIAAPDLLRDARHRVASGWCQHASARDRTGRIVEPWDVDASSWSLLGAIVAVTEPRRLERGHLSLTELTTALGALAELIADPSLESWNDAPERVATEVIEVLDRATVIAARH